MTTHLHNPSPLLYLFHTRTPEERSLSLSLKSKSICSKVKTQISLIYQWGDDLSRMQLRGNKVRKLEFLLANVVAQGADYIVTIGGIQSNHYRATVVAAKYLNLDCYLIPGTSKVLDKDPGFTGNLLVERLVGAHVDLVSKEDYYNVGSSALDELLKEKLLEEGRKPYVIPVDGSYSGRYHSLEF